MSQLLHQIIETAVAPAYCLLPPKMASAPATLELLAIGLQESDFLHRFQIVAGNPNAKGPAKGLWQFERGGGVRGVMRHKATAALARAVCESRGVAWNEHAVHLALEVDDVLAAAFARLLLYSDPAPLPSLDAPASIGWDYYTRTWRPGKPHPKKWPRVHAEALAFVKGL